VSNLDKKQYVCLCGNNKDEHFEYLGKEGKTKIFICKECNKIIKIDLFHEGGNQIGERGKKGIRF
jgi:Fe2+ or Zn2+ uptake regulation protein